MTDFVRVRRMRRTGSPRGVPRIDAERANARVRGENCETPLVVEGGRLARVRALVAGRGELRGHAVVERAHPEPVLRTGARILAGGRIVRVVPHPVCWVQGPRPSRLGAPGMAPALV